MDNGSQVRYAGFWVRFGATLIDTLWLSLIIIPLLMAFYGKDYFSQSHLIAGPADFMINFIFPFIAVVVFWHYRSATPGKMYLGLEIVDATTLQKPTNSQLIIRYAGYYVSTIFLCLGFLWIAIDPRKQGWHDKLANTVVIYRRAN